MDEKPQSHRFRFGLRTLFEIIAVVAFILTLIYYRSAAVQDRGRYQFDKIDRGSDPLVIDNQTGHLWRWNGTGWTDYGEPPKPAK